MNRVILWIAAWLVPVEQREEWLAEWTSELWYVAGCKSRAFCMGSFKDALWMRRNSPKSIGVGWLRSPSRCIFAVAAPAVASACIACRLPWYGRAQPISAHLMILLIALLIATTSLATGDNPGPGHSLIHAARVSRRIFFGVKLGLILAAVFFGTFDVGTIIGSGGLQPQATLVGYIVACRWAVADQRRRCPVCLRLLTNPIRIGEPSRTFLELYGTELLCGKGHGVMYVPEIPASYAAQRWVDLDASWGVLFGAGPGGPAQTRGSAPQRI